MKNLSYDRFVNLLNSKGITPYKVHKDTGIATATLSDWKNGKSTPKPDKMQILADYFNVSLEYLITGNEHEGGETYFLNEETKEIAQEIFKNKELRMLFEVSRHETSEHLTAYYNLIKSMQDAERHKK